MYRPNKFDSYFYADFTNRTCRLNLYVYFIIQMIVRFSERIFDKNEKKISYYRVVGEHTFVYITSFARRLPLSPSSSSSLSS